MSVEPEADAVPTVAYLVDAEVVVDVEVLFAEEVLEPPVDEVRVVETLTVDEVVPTVGLGWPGSTTSVFSVLVSVVVVVLPSVLFLVEVDDWTAGVVLSTR